MALPHTDWLRHTLLVAGPPVAVAEFRHAAAGSGGTPWAFSDLDYEQDDRFMALVKPPDGSPGIRPAAARVLAREFHEAEFQHQRKVRALASRSRACPFDLQALIPVPPALLDLGPDHPKSIAWLRVNWGVLQSLRKVHLIATGCKKLRGKREQMAIAFWSADWTPWPAIAATRRRFPSLKFTISPDYEDG